MTDRDEYFGMPTVYEASTDSTNACAKRAVVGGYVTGRPSLWIADCQTAGHGRMGRQFFSPAGSGVYFSVALRCHTPLDSMLPVTGAAAVAVALAVEPHIGERVGIKWVNDVLWRGKKVCGILAEGVTFGDAQYLILGIGINVCDTAFPPELKDVAGTLGLPADVRMPLVRDVLLRLTAYLDALPACPFLEDYRARDVLAGREITLTERGVATRAVALGITERCGLSVRTENGESLVLQSGEVTVRYAT